MLIISWTSEWLLLWLLGFDFNRLAESRSNPQLLDINVHRTIFDTDVIVHFAGDDADRMRLLESESSDSLFLKAATPS